METIPTLDQALALQGEARQQLGDYRQAHDDLPDEDVVVAPDYDPLKSPANAVAATLDQMLSALPKAEKGEEGEAREQAEPTFRAATPRPDVTPEIHLGSDGGEPIYHFRPGYNAAYMIAHATNHADLRARLAGVVSMLQQARSVG